MRGPPQLSPYRPVTSASPLFLMIAVGGAGIALGALLAWTWLAPREKLPPPLPNTWALSPRLVFNVSERRLYRQLKVAFPQHVVMPKLPLVRLCQPEDLETVHDWYGLLGSTYVTFAICSPNGKALLAVDLESRRSRSQRSIDIKEAVLAACRVGYFNMAADGIPTTDALRLLMPNSSVEAAPIVAPIGGAAPVALVSEVGPVAPPAIRGHGDRTVNGQDPSVFLDSFFSPDRRLEPAGGVDSSHALPDSAVDWNLFPDGGGGGGEDTPAPSTESPSARSAAVR